MTKLQLNRNISKREHKFTDTVVRFVSYIDFKHLYGTINDNCFMTDNIRVLVSKLIIYSMAFQESWMHYRENRKGTSSIVVTPLCVNKCVNKTCAILQTTGGKDDPNIVFEHVTTVFWHIIHSIL